MRLKRWGRGKYKHNMRGYSFLHSCIHSSFTEYVVYTSVVAKISHWRESIDHQSQKMLMEVHCHFFAKTILPHAAPTQLHELNRMPRQCYYWGIHDFGGFGPRSPWHPCWTSLELHNNLRCFQPIFLPSLSPLPKVRCASWSDGSPSLLAPSSFSLPGISPKKFLAVFLRLGVCFTEDPTSLCLALLQKVLQIQQGTRKICLLLSMRPLSL